MTVDHRNAARAPAGRRSELFCSTALVATALAFAPHAALAQAVIDNGDHEIVDGDGLGAGAPPSTQPSPWNIGGVLTVGDDATGLLTVRNGGAVSSTVGYIGRSAGSTGAVTVTGTDSTWTNGALVVGLSGSGALTIADGGAVSGTATWIGRFEDSAGEVTVTGAGSTWTTSGLSIGDLGDGTLTIEDGGTVSSTASRIGYEYDSTGEVTVTGAGSTWINSGELRVGEFGDVTLTLSNGGTVSASGVTLAAHVTGTATLNFGAAAGAAAVAAGSLDTPTIGFGAGASTIVFNHTSDDFELDADISGNGTIRLLAGRTLLSGDSSYTGSTLLEGGTLSLGSDAALGASTLTTLGSIVDYVDGVTIANAIVIDSNTTQFQVLTGSATQSGVISQNNGPRPFEKIGEGELVLTAANSWTGETTVREGTLTFDGGSMALGAGQDFYVGSLSGDDGAMVIENGGSVSNREGSIGRFINATGTVTVTGAGSTWTNSGGLHVGIRGTGTLSIADGGAVSSSGGSIGGQDTATGMVTVTGAGSTWTNSSILYVGSAGSGALSIADGGAVSSSAGYIGTDDDAIGEVTVAGAGSTWTNSSFLFVGAGANGALTIESGGAVSNTDGFIGRFADSTGAATVTGAGSTWTNSDRLYVGLFGNGTLTVADGGSVSNTEGHIGSAPGAVTVTGAGSTWTNSSFLRVGTFGSGSLTIEAGGAVSNTEGYIGYAASSTGEATVTGAGSTWTNSGGLRVGMDGDGALTIADGGAVSNTIGLIGNAVGATGDATVTGAGSSWANSSTLTVGVFGSGALSVENGGAVSNAEGRIGAEVGSTGEATVTGAGSSWTNSSALYVGRSGDGALTVADGGAVSNANGLIGHFAGSAGDVIVTGAGSSWTSSALRVGSAGSGTLTVADGGAVSNTEGSIGHFIGSAGDVTVTGANSTWTNSSFMVVGQQGDGTLTVADGGAVSNANGTIGNAAGIAGVAIVTGAGSTWTNSGTLRVGNLGVGTLTIADGGAVSASGVTLAANASGTGTLNFGAAAGDAAVAAGSLDTPTIGFGNGTGTIIFNHTDNDFELDADISGTGAIDVLAGLTALSGDSSGFSGQTAVSGGDLRVTGSLGSDVTVSGGSLGGSGAVLGAVSVGAGSLVGGQGSTLSLGSLSLSAASSVDVTLGAPDTVGLFDIGGDLTLDGTLNVTDAGGFGAGIYRLFDYDGTLTNNGLDIGSTPSGVAADDLFVQTAVDQQINLVSAAGVDLLVWDGAGPADDGAISGGSGVWTLGDRSWTTADGAVNGGYDNPGFAIFQGAAGTVVVDGSDIGITGLQVASDGYRIEGDGIELAADESLIRVGDGTAAGAGYTATIASALTGAGQLVKTDLGTLILTGANGYTGGTNVRHGVLIGDTAAIRGDLVNDATVIFDQASDGTFSGAISGGGAIIKDGAGTLTLTGSNSYTGGLEVRQGALVGDTASIVGDVENNALLVFYQNFDGTFSGALSGSGASAKDGTGTLTLAGASAQDWSVAAGELWVGAASFAGDISVDAGAIFRFDPAIDTAWAGMLSGAGDFSKSGAAALTLTGNSADFAGTTSVTGGMLVVEGSLGGDVTVSGGSLGGSGAVLGAVSIGAGRLVGTQGQVLTLGSLDLAAASRVEVTLGAPGAAALFDIGGDLTLDGTLNIADTGSFGAGVYGLFTYGGSLTDNGLAVGDTPVGSAAGYLFVQTAAAGRVNLVNTTGVDLLFWDGGDAARHDNGAIEGGAGVWSAGSRTWTDADGAINGAMRPMPGFAVFQGTAGTVTVEGGDIGVTGMQFATDGYRIEGDGIELDADESLIRVGDGSAGGAGYTATITSALTGTGRLVKTDLGTLILTGANSYEGGTEIRHGVLVGDTASIAGDVHNDARLVFDQGFDGRFAGSLSGSGAAMKDGAGTLTLAGASVQDWSIAAGELSVGTAAFSGDISVDAGASFRFDPAIDTAWAGMLSGAGDFSKSGAAALTLTGNSADFAGTTSVTGGMLVVDGTLGGLLTVGANGTVAGSGRIGALTLGAGGSVAPGNSIGTLDIAGDLTIAAGSLYEVETDPVGTASDRIAVGGTAALNGGTVQHVGLPGAYAPVSTYTILTAAGGITGRFDAVDSDFAFLEARLDYASDAVRLVLERNDISFAGIGQTVNQRATAGAIEAGGWGAPLYDAAVGLNEADARGAFDRLSGELHASLRSALVEDSARVRGLLVRRLPEAGAGRQGVTMWAQVHGAASDLSTDGNAASLHSRTGGLWLGAEAVSPDLVFGLAFGAERSTHDAPAGNGEAEREGYRLAAYGARYWGTFKLSGGFAAAWDDIETARTATFPDFANTLDAGYDARTAQAFVEAGWSIPAGAGAIEPYAALAHVRAESDAFSETGGSAALTVDSQDQAVTFATLGLGTRRTLDFGQGRTAEIGGRIGWRHAMGDLTPHNRQAFDTGTIFTVEGLPIEDNALMVEFASQIRIRDALTLHIDWTGQIGNRHTAQHLSATLSWRF